MTAYILRLIAASALMTTIFSSCSVLKQSSKYNFNDGTYKTKKFSADEVYVMRVDEDTLAVFPIKEYKDSTAIMVKQRVDYCSAQRKLKDNKTSCTFYKPSFDVDVMTMPLKYRPATAVIPNQLTTNFNGAFYGGYRIDAYDVKYKRTPLNNWKQNIKHMGYSAGLFLGLGSSMIDATTLDDPSYPHQYEGALLLCGVAVNIAVENLNFGVCFGPDYLLDKNHNDWIYQGKPTVGLTFGLNIN